MEKTLFGIFHTAYERSGERFFQFAKSDYVNTFIVESDYRGEAFAVSMEELGKHGDKTAWIAVSRLGFRSRSRVTVADTGEDDSAFNPVTEFLADYKSNVDAFVSFLKEKGWYDRVEGFYMDEPLLWNISNEDLEAFTKYFRTEAAKDKRFFVCFSIAGVCPEYWTINDVKPITPSSVRYLTDIAFDMYHAWSEDYQRILRAMTERSGNRKDLRVWMIPCTMNYRGDKDEEYCLAHLNGCYETLKSLPVPGGLMCFTWHTFSREEEDLGNVGLDVLTDPRSGNYYSRLQARVEEIGREICGGKFDEDRRRKRFAKPEKPNGKQTDGKPFTEAADVYYGRERMGYEF